MAHDAKVPGISEGELIRLVNTYDRTLLGICSLLLCDRHLAEDMVQETYFRAWKGMDPSKGTEKAWLIKVAVNLCHDYHRSRWFRHQDRRILPENLPEQAEAEDSEIILLVKQLPLPEREVVILHFWQRMGADEIASLLHITRSTVYRRLKKAQKHLKLELEGGMTP